MPEHENIIAPPVEDSAANRGKFVKPSEIAEAGLAFLVVDVELDHAGRYGQEVVYSVLVKESGPARISFSQTQRRAKHAAEVKSRLQDAAAVGPFALVAHTFDGRDGEPVTTYVFATHETAGPVVLAEYEGEV